MKTVHSVNLKVYHLFSLYKVGLNILVSHFEKQNGLI